MYGRAAGFHCPVLLPGREEGIRVNGIVAVLERTSDFGKLVYGTGGVEALPVILFDKLGNTNLVFHFLFRITDM